MFIRIVLTSALVLLPGLCGGHALNGADSETWDGSIVQYGKMHEAIGQQQHHGRVQLKKLVEKPHFFGVAALEQLEGEATILDGKITMTRVDAKGHLDACNDEALDKQATLLVGAYVPAWTEHKVMRNVGSDEFDAYLADAATKAGIKSSEPFVFQVEGAFSNVAFHVINGACPMHARLKKIELPKEKQPFEAELQSVRGTVVGIFAKNAVGNITHPATSTHMHLVYEDAKIGKLVTGHVEQIELQAGAILRLPKTK